MPPTQKLHRIRLPRTIVALGWVSLLNDSASEMIYPLLPVFLTSVLGASPAFIGVIEGIAEATASLLKLVVGSLSDKIKRRKIFIVCGYTLATFTRPLIGAATSGFHVLIARFLDRSGKGLRTAPRDALLADAADQRDLGKAFGFHRSMDHLGAVIGPALALLLLAWFHGDLRVVFWLSAIPGVIGILILVFMVKEKRAEAGKAGVRQPLFQFRGLPGNFRWLLASVGLFALGNSSDAFLVLRASTLGIPTEQLPLLWILLHIVKSVTSMPGGMLSDTIGRRPTIIGGWLVYALVYTGFAFASSILHIWVLFTLYGIYFGLTEGVEKAFIAQMLPAERRGAAFGMYHCVLGVMAFPASIVFGYLWTAYGNHVAFLTGSALAFTASFLLIFTVHEKRD
jgi:MFS family permease